MRTDRKKDTTGSSRWLLRSKIARRVRIHVSLGAWRVCSRGRARRYPLAALSVRCTRSLAHSLYIFTAQQRQQLLLDAASLRNVCRFQCWSAGHEYPPINILFLSCFFTIPHQNQVKSSLFLPYTRNLEIRRREPVVKSKQSMCRVCVW